MQPGFEPEMLGATCFCLGGILIGALVLVVFYLITLQTALSRVAPRNRLMEPGSVWLMLVPCVNIIWQFMVATRVPDSLRNEFRDRGRDDGTDYGKSIALTQVILGFVASAINGLSRTAGREAAVGVAIIVLIVSLIDLALFIVFWVRIAGYSAQLAADDRGQRDWERRFDDYDDDDDRGPPREGPRVPPPDSYREGDPAVPPPESYREGDPGAIKK